MTPGLAAVTVSRLSELDELDVTSRDLVRDLHTASPRIYWADLLASAAVGWGAFAVAVMAVPFSALMLAATIVSALALYRCLCFTHEITHFRRGVVPGFETAWNLIVGVPLLLPTFTYVGVHHSHHALSTYGTKDDPEYLPFATSRQMIVVFAVQSALLIPVVLLLRFVVLSAIGLLWPPFHRWLETYASSFSMNPSYRRQVSPGMARTMRRWEAFVLAAWLGFIGAVYAGVVPMHVLTMWLVVLVVVSFLNTLRVLGAHEYESDGSVRDRQGQLIDSLDHPGRAWTELWAPVGLRYHALHHYFPGIPYHNLGIAYRRIVGTEAGAVYRRFSSQSLSRSLAALYAKARAASASGS